MHFVCIYIYEGLIDSLEQLNERLLIKLINQLTEYHVNDFSDNCTKN